MLAGMLSSDYFLFRYVIFWVVLILSHRLRHCPNLKPTLANEKLINPLWLMLSQVSLMHYLCFVFYSSFRESTFRNFDSSGLYRLCKFVECLTNFPCVVCCVTECRWRVGGHRKLRGGRRPTGVTTAWSAGRDSPPLPGGQPRLVSSQGTVLRLKPRSRRSHSHGHTQTSAQPQSVKLQNKHWKWR